MGKFEGTLEYVDLGSGSWNLVTDDGKQLTLVGDVPERLNGQRVAVRGRKKLAFGITMTGPAIIEVRSVKAV